jgi:hypothetical protein
LTAYIWGFSIAKGKENCRKSRRGNQVQKGGVVYAGDVERDISNIEPSPKKLEDELSIPQQMFAVRRPEHPDRNPTVVHELGWEGGKL